MVSGLLAKWVTGSAIAQVNMPTPMPAPTPAAGGVDQFVNNLTNGSGDRATFWSFHFNFYKGHRGSYAKVKNIGYGANTPKGNSGTVCGWINNKRNDAWVFDTYIMLMRGFMQTHPTSFAAWVATVA